MASVTQASAPHHVGDRRPSSEADPEKNGFAATTKVTGDSGSSGVPDAGADSDGFQGGVQRTRAITELWSRKTLWLMFALLYLVSFVDAITNSVQGTLNPYITSEFGQHGLLTSANVISTILSGCFALTLAKIVDIFGRVEGFLFMLLVNVVSLIMKAVAGNMETYVAAHTMYWTSHIGLLYVVDVMLADMTTLRNRMIMFGLNGTPLIASTFAGPAIADLFYTNTYFRWAYGAFAIITVGVCLPVATIQLIMQRRANKAGMLDKLKSDRNWMQSVWHYFIEFDFLGIILITAAFALFLLPFSIAVYAPNGWATGYIIAMLVLGFLLFPVFFVWEKWFAPVQFLPWVYLKDPTLLGSCVLYAFMFASCFIWNAYFFSYLQVVHRLSITTAGYVLNAFSLTSAIFSPIFGVLISWTGDFKWTAYAGIPCYILGTALLIPFRTPDTHVGLLVLTQVLVGLGSGLFTTCGQLAIQVPVTHQQVAVVIAIYGLFGSIGAGIGNSIAGAMWNNMLPEQIYQRLPEDSKDMAAQIFGDLVTQMSFEDGTEERDAIVGAYAYVQRRMVIAGACLVPVCLGAIFVWKNTNVRKLEEEKGKQMKGNVF